MKKKSFFKEPLLISQEEMALMLGITRSQWSMYVLGQRDVSATSKVKLARIQLHVNKVTVATHAQLTQEQNQEEATQRIRKKLLDDNKVKQLQWQRKLSRMEENYQAALNTLHFVNSFQEEGFSQSVLDVLGIKAKNVLEANGLPHQEVCRIKLEVLGHEEKVLQRSMQKLL